MALIIAIVLIVIVGIKVADDKARTRQYKNESAKRFKQHDEWVSLHVDSELESRLNSFISNKDNYNAVWEEVSATFKKLEHWKNFTKFSLLKDKKIVLDIMLANRGKVSFDAAVFGYRAYLSSESDMLKKSQFELVEWIRDTLNQKGADVDLIYSGVGDSLVPADCYYWIGTMSSLPLVGETTVQRFKKFSKELIK